MIRIGIKMAQTGISQRGISLVFFFLMSYFPIVNTPYSNANAAPQIRRGIISKV
jgi:hypothetical protein